jgi:hypothetical protein
VRNSPFVQGEREKRERETDGSRRELGLGVLPLSFRCLNRPMLRRMRGGASGGGVQWRGPPVNFSTMASSFGGKV